MFGDPFLSLDPAFKALVSRIETLERELKTLKQKLHEANIPEIKRKLDMGPPDWAPIFP